MPHILIKHPTHRWYSGITIPMEVISEDHEFFIVHPKHRINPVTGHALTSVGKVAKEDCEIVNA